LPLENETPSGETPKSSGLKILVRRCEKPTNVKTATLAACDGPRVPRKPTANGGRWFAIQNNIFRVIESNSLMNRSCWVAISCLQALLVHRDDVGVFA